MSGYVPLEPPKIEWHLHDKSGVWPIRDGVVFGGAWDGLRIEPYDTPNR